MRADLRDKNKRVACLEADVEIPTYLSFICRVAHKASSRLCSPQNSPRRKRPGRPKPPKKPSGGGGSGSAGTSGATRTSLLHPAVFLSFFAALLNAVLGGYRWDETPREVAVVRSRANTLKSSPEKREIKWWIKRHCFHLWFCHYRRIKNLYRRLFYTYCL